MSRFEALYECYHTGQMSEADMNRLMRSDAMFAAYVRRKDVTRLAKGRHHG